MSHLPTERLAALVDESPTAEELSHLASCAECARERAALGGLAELASAESARIGTPLTNWESLRPALMADGVIDNGRSFQPRARQVRRPWLQAAAAVLLVAGGMMAGRYSAGGSPLANVSTSTVASTDSAPTFKTIEEAVAAQNRAQLTYQTATAFLAQHDTANSAETPATIRARLAALDRTGQVLSEARNESPYDPVINGYYLTTMGQREAALRQLNTVMPASMKITSY